ELSWLALQGRLSTCARKLLLATVARTRRRHAGVEALLSQLRRDGGQIRAWVGRDRRRLGLAEVQLVDARRAESRRVGASQRDVVDRGVASAELVGEVRPERAVTHGAGGDAGLEVANPRRVAHER